MIKSVTLNNFRGFDELTVPLSSVTMLTGVNGVRIINPHITDIRLSDIESGLSIVLDDNSEVSIGTIGNGAVTWASVLMAIFDVAELNKQQLIDVPTLILVDEMGAGIHYSVMLNVWKFLSGFVYQNRNIQFIFTTHSDDCIKAFCKAFSDQDMAAIVRLHQTSTDKRIVPTEYKKEAFQSIINAEWEVRG